MINKTQTAHITPAGGNVFADLGFAPAEAIAFKAEADAIIAKKLAIKESLMTEISVWIETKHLKQVDAAKILGITRPRVSDVVHKKTVNFTIDSLCDMVARTGRQVELSVR